MTDDDPQGTERQTSTSGAATPGQQSGAGGAGGSGAGAGDGSTRPRIELTPEHAYYLQRTQVVSELHEELETWAKKRFWGIAFIVVVVGVVGVRALVRDMIFSELRAATKATAVAEAASEHVTEVTKKIRSEADLYGQRLKDLSSRADEVGSEMDNLRSRIQAEGLHAIATASLEIKTMGEKLQELDTLVRTIATSSQATGQSLARYEEGLSRLDTNASQTKAQFADNSKFDVLVVFHPDDALEEQLATSIVSALSNAGFKASTGTWVEGAPTHGRIDIEYGPGAASAADSAREILQTVHQTLGHTLPPIQVSAGRPAVIDDREIRIFF